MDAHNSVLSLGGADVQSGGLVFDYAGGFGSGGNDPRPVDGQL